MLNRWNFLKTGFYEGINYEYGIYWNFYQDATLELEIKLTGVANTTALMPGEKPKYGTEVAPQLNAPYHQHIFNARLDMCVDGTNNSVFEVNSKRLPRDNGNPHGNAFVAEHTLLEKEKDAQRLCNMTSSRYWKVVNPAVRNRMDQPVGYRLLPAENAVPFAHDDAAVIKRAGFLTRHLWVTPYRADEKYAAGDYPNQRADGDGLPKWTEANRPIADADVVVWYTFGHTHMLMFSDSVLPNWPAKMSDYGDINVDSEGAGKTSGAQQLTGRAHDPGPGGNPHGSERTPHQAHPGGL